MNFFMFAFQNRRLNFEILKYQRENRIPDEEIRHLLEPETLSVPEEPRPSEWFENFDMKRDID